MLPLFLALLAADPPPSVLRIMASEPDAILGVRADAPGWSSACPAAVTVDRPCQLAATPAPQIVDLRIWGTRVLDSSVVLQPPSTTVRIDHEGYARSGVGLVIVAAAIGLIAGGVSTFQDGNDSGGRALISIGAAVEASGLILILNDLTRKHDRVVVVE